MRCKKQRGTYKETGNEWSVELCAGGQHVAEAGVDLLHHLSGVFLGQLRVNFAEQ